ncbi:abd7ba81-4b73-499c-b18d-f0478a1d8879 [Sclerotinia trifoliorum]|uniref:Abd7ba81-4b73-499c-b18d-f0478a1d8879 n=1 Tax=Sclerotinia trifoliorum TaxID=28548 RepID=A0A8H2VN52_9HELO|nr:abd7ba81-4b73-499c-b18d-f0478a1d8879 [Sclerotinia trifoliorum]
MPSSDFCQLFLNCSNTHGNGTNRELVDCGTRMFPSLSFSLLSVSLVSMNKNDVLKRPPDILPKHLEMAVGEQNFRHEYDEDAREICWVVSTEWKLLGDLSDGFMCTPIQ